MSDHPPGEPAPEQDDGPPPDPAQTRKRAIIGIVAAVVIGGAATAIAYYAEAHTGFVARVDGARISKAEYERHFEQAKRQYVQRYNVDFATAQGRQMEADIRAGLMNQLIERELIHQEAQRRDITVPDTAVASKLDEIQRAFRDKAEFERKLKDNGLDMPTFTEQVRSQLEVERVVEAVTKDAEVPEAEVRAYYDKNRDTLYKRSHEVRARHILVKDEALAKKIAADLAKGADFSALAREHSTDPGSKAEGGDLGYFPRGKMVKEFEDAAFALKPGQVSPLVRTKFGWHLIKLEDRKPPRTQPYEEVRDEIRQNMASERRRKIFGDWLTGRKAQARVEYRPGFAPPSRPPAAHGADDGHGHGPGDGHGH